MKVRTRFHWMAVALAALAPAVARAELSATEQRIVAAVKERTPAALQFLEKVVNVNSGTMNPEGVREAGALFRAELDALGFRTRWIDMPPEMRRAGHLVATHEGTHGKRLLLIGHIDTVFEKTSPVTPWDRRGDRVRGQGVADMKGGDVIVLQALHALKVTGELDSARITVVFTGDEERAGDPIEVARAALVDAAKMSDVALAFEGTVKDKDGRDTATVGRRASSGWQLLVTGKPGHSGGVFGESSGYGAIYEGARILNAFRESLVEPGLTFNPGVVIGGTKIDYDAVSATGTAFGKVNVIASGMRVQGDLRYVDYAQRDRAQAKMREIVAASLAGARAAITFHEAYPPMAPTKGNHKLLRGSRKRARMPAWAR
jgi:glutamate carboxypeptidase